MELEDILKDLDEWLFVVSPQLLVLELEYFSLLASKTWVHKQLLVSIDLPIHPQTMALFWHSHYYCFHPQTRPKFPELVKSSSFINPASKIFLQINQIHVEILTYFGCKMSKKSEITNIFSPFTSKSFAERIVAWILMEKMLVVKFHILHPKSSTLENRLKSVWKLCFEL